MGATTKSFFTTVGKLLAGLTFLLSVWLVTSAREVRLSATETQANAAMAKANEAMKAAIIAQDNANEMHLCFCILTNQMFNIQKTLDELTSLHKRIN